MTLSIVTTAYRSAGHLDEFVRRVTESARRITDDYELIVVNDGSPDNSLDILVHLCGNDDHIKVVDLSRNFGHHKALMTGIGMSTGDRVFLIDSDLEEAPEDLSLYWDTLAKNQSADVAFGVQRERRGGCAKRFGGGWFYAVFNALSDIKMPRNLITSRLMTRRYANALLSFREQELTIAGLFSAAGFIQVPVIVDKKARCNSTYSLARRVGLLVNAVTSFSNKPLRMVFYLGTLITIAALSFVVYSVVRKYLLDEVLSGWTSLIASVWLVGGLVIFSLGVIGIYLSKVFIEVKSRPYTIIRRIYPDGK